MTEPVLDLGEPRSIHLVGLGGAGISGIATVLARMGHTVSGSDLKDSPVLERLRLHGITAYAGHDAAHLPADLDVVVRSTAIPDANPEVQAALAAGIPVLRRAGALAAITRTRRTVAVSGTHGKTTTSSMLALALRGAGWRPSFLIGGEVNEVGGNALYDDGEWLVVEADESDGTFVEIDAEAVVVTNVEADHLDHYGTMDTLEAAFGRFVTAPDGPVVVCADDPGARSLVERRPDAVTYGFAPDAAYSIEGYRARAGGSEFSLRRPTGDRVDVALAVPGRHNASNASAAVAMAIELGADASAVTASLSSYTGVSRRFQYRGEVGGVTVVDDYAHLPAEVRAVLAAAREGDWGRVVAVFQPHRFSRTEALWREFGDAFGDADVLVLTDVYPAGEAPRPGVSGALILSAVLDGGYEGRVVYLPRRGDVEAHVMGLTRPGDLVLTLGAGDITSVADVWVARDAS